MTLIEQQHSTMVAALIKPGEDILASLSAEDCHLWHMTTLLVGESGEFSEGIKKHVVYGKPIDRVNALEELGDIEFALNALREIFGFTREEVLQANIDKLSKRYSSGSYSDAQAQTRADKADSDLGELDASKACKLDGEACESCQ